MNDFLHAFIQYHPLTSGVKCLHIRCVLNCDIQQGKANKTKHVRLFLKIGFLQKY